MNTTASSKIVTNHEIYMYNYIVFKYNFFNVFCICLYLICFRNAPGEDIKYCVFVRRLHMRSPARLRKRKNIKRIY